MKSNKRLTILVLLGKRGEIVEINSTGKYNNKKSFCLSHKKKMVFYLSFSR
jgi:hypothetical protein